MKQISEKDANVLTFEGPNCAPPHVRVVRFLIPMGVDGTFVLELCNACAEDLKDRLNQAITPDAVEVQHESEYR